jgi:hypothetical protein
MINNPELGIHTGSMYEKSLLEFRRNIKSPRFPMEVYEWFERNKPLVEMPWGYVFGEFADVPEGRIYNGDPISLTGDEMYMESVIRRKLQHQEIVRAVGLGEGLGLSFFSVASHFCPELVAGRLQLYITHHDPFASIGQ